MADQLVNPESAAQLQPRNQEPTHLTGLSWDDLGGTGIDSAPNSATIAASSGVKGQDTTIPRSVAAEPSHLTSMKMEGDETPDELEIEFGDEKSEETDVDMDDLDKALDEFDDLPKMDIDLKTEEAEEDDEKKLDEEDDEDEKKSDMVAEESEDDEKKLDEEDDEDEKKLDEEDEKSDVEKMDEEDEDEKKLDEEDEKSDVEKMDEEDEDEKKEVVKESVKIRVKMPKTSLFESAGFSAKQQKKVAAIFESSLKSTTRRVSAQLHEHYQQVHRRKLAAAQSKMASRLNEYLQVVVEEWFNANRVSVRQSLRADLAESFLNGLQSLFKEHYIDVPESKVDVVKSLTREVKALRSQVNEQMTQKMKLRKLAEAANKKRIVAEFSRTLSESQVAKLEQLAEDTAYVSAKDFREKLTMLKESYFESRPSQVTRLPEESVQAVKETRGKSEVDVVADAISRQVKSNW